MEPCTSTLSLSQCSVGPGVDEARSTGEGSLEIAPRSVLTGGERLGRGVWTDSGSILISLIEIVSVVLFLLVFF